jgi:hypothetical protein
LEGERILYGLPPFVDVISWFITCIRRVINSIR